MSYIILVSSVLFNIYTKKWITKKHKAIGTWHRAVETIAEESIKADCYLVLLGRQKHRKEKRDGLLPGTVCLQNV